MEKIRNLSIRKSIILYMGIAIFVGFSLSIACMWFVEHIQQNIWKKYVEIKDVEIADKLDDTEEQIYDFSRSVDRIDGKNMTSMDAIFSNICDFVDTWCVLIITMVACAYAIFIFYHSKIKEPLELLEYGSKMISNQQLDFHIVYDNKDELGRLCAQFENMREELENNNKKIWGMVEQEKMLRDAIAHDIRSPLAVIKGYQETLKVFVPKGKLDESNIVEIAESCLKQVDRLDEFVEAMKHLSKVDDREICKSKVSLQYIIEHIQEITGILNQSEDIICEFSGDDIGEVSADIYLIFEVYENLLSNAFRYGKKKIKVDIKKNDNFLCINVSDDGIGFQNNIMDIRKAYYHENPTDDGSHLGLGLYICNTYCEKHGGHLQLGNLESGGAYAKAVFDITEE